MPATSSDCSAHSPSATGALLPQPSLATALDVLSTYYGSYGLAQTLDFAWDQTSGQNGDKLALTITVSKASPLGGAHAFMIVSKRCGRVAVWPGLVVE